ncbi:MAG: hypothetical protein HC939_02440 [Pleurocapsa sp. SU_5_0]|nr:hypothetical protein [Pleurocapsa sp. SU_5_0]NJR48037.1 hypothetical protein [Hyellaceae cyanobacterium CSU_1_1]
MIQSILWWLFVAFLTLSLIIFIGFYLRGAFRDRIRYKVKHAPRPEEPQFPYTLASITNSFITDGIITDFWNEAAAIQRARLDAISKARHNWTFGNGTADLSRFKFRNFNLNSKDEDNDQGNKHNLMLVVPGANPRIRFSPIQAFKYNSILCARKRIWLASPYFLPDDNSIDLLVAAKQDGVDVRILTTSIRSDKKAVYYASFEHYGKLLKGGVAIYEFQP